MPALNAGKAMVGAELKQRAKTAPKGMTADPQ